MMMTVVIGRMMMMMVLIVDLMEKSDGGEDTLLFHLSGLVCEPNLLPSLLPSASFLPSSVSGSIWYGSVPKQVAQV